MELTLSTHLLVYHTMNARALQALQHCGCGGAEVWLAEPHVPWRNESRLREFGQALADSGLCTHTVHLPFYPSVPDLLERGETWSVIAPDPADRRVAIQGMAEGLHAAAALGAEGAVLHLGWPKDVWTSETQALADSAVAELLPIAKKCGVKLLLENIISNGTRAGALVQLLNRVDPHEEAGICLDLGHAHVLGGVLAELEDALPRLDHLHVHDNDGKKDAHLAPGQGSIPWAEVLKKLEEGNYQGSGALEIRDFSKGKQDLEEVMKEQMQHVDSFRDDFFPQDA